jgi:hypothetical protein
MRYCSVTERRQLSLFEMEEAMSKMGFCEEGRRLKKEYEAALHGWERFSLLHRGQSTEKFSGDQAAYPWQESLTERNAAADRMYLHRTHCPHCRRQR